MKQYNLTKKDITSNYFHFTNKQNLEDIKKMGLLPKKGKHAKLLEQTPKVFFVKGLDNLLVLFDCWLNVWEKAPLVNNKCIYALGIKLMKSKCFPQIITDIYFKTIKNSKRHQKNAYRVFDEIIERSILLNLNLKEGIDFLEEDIDEIKIQPDSKRHLIIMGYSEKYADMNSPKMDSWNMHTLSNHGINIDKIKLCNINHSSKMKDILEFVLKNTTLEIKDTCPVLYRYLKNTNCININLEEKKI